MPDWDVVIVGGGPAGLAAGLYLSRGKLRTLLLEQDSLGGPMKNYERIENYPGFSDGVSGAVLGSQMADQARKYGMQTRQARAEGLDLYSSGRFVACADGTGYAAGVVILAGGCRPKKLGVPGEKELLGKGVFHCAVCDGSPFAGRVVAVCGGGDAGITEALYMTRLASRVVLIEAMPALTACAVLQERAAADPKLEIRTGTRAGAIVGQDKVEAIELVDKAGQAERLSVDGVLVHIGLEPNTEYLEGTVPLDAQGRVIVNEKMETQVPYVLAAGDIRSGSPNQIVTAVGDGATAALSAIRALREIT